VSDVEALGAATGAGKGTLITGKTASRLLPPWLPEATGLLLAAWVSVAVDIPLRRSPGGILIWALAYCALTLAANVSGVLAVSYLVPGNATISLRAVLLRSSAAAVWFPGLFHFAFPRSAWLAVPAMMLGITLTRVAAVHRDPDSPTSKSLTRSQLGPMRWPPRRLPPFLASACLQATVIAAMTGYPRTAGTLAAFSAGFLLWSFPLLRSREENRAAPTLSVILSVAVSMVFSLAALMSLIANSGGFQSEYSISNALLRSIFGSPSRLSQAPAPQPASDDPNSLSHGGGFSGVILVPESKPQAILLAPPPEPIRGFTVLPSREPLKLAFRGVYWFYKQPNSRPPKHSFSTRGNPVKTSLRSSDEYPLLMAAHQEFSTPVDLSCCSEIQVGISNAEGNPGTVWLELVLTDTRSAVKGKKEWISLKPQPVTSSILTEPGKQPEPAHESLIFPIPAGAAIRQFDEITIRYRLGPERAHRSARIEIEDFVFTPRQR
jgi:hypothetical protein